MPLTMNDDEPLYEYACHEGNYAIKNILSGSRIADAAAEKTQATEITSPPRDRVHRGIFPLRESSVASVPPWLRT